MEFPSGFRRDDTLDTVVTIMVNLSGSPWTSPRKLSELFAIDDPEMLRYVNDYEMVIVDPYVMKQEELERYTGEVKTLFSLLAYKDDMEAHSKYIMSLKEEDDVISDEAWRMLEEYAGFREMDRSKSENEEGKVVVSRAIEQRVQMAVQQGNEQRRELLEGYVTLIKNRMLSREEVSRLLKITPEEFDRRLAEAGLSLE